MIGTISLIIDSETVIYNRSYKKLQETIASIGAVKAVMILGNNYI